MTIQFAVLLLAYEQRLNTSGIDKAVIKFSSFVQFLEL